MTTTYGQPGGNNTYVPSTVATGNLIFTFLRGPRSWAVNKYTQKTKVSKTKFLWGRLDWRNAGRGTRAEHAWVDGDDQPSGRGKAAGHAFIQGETERYSYRTSLGNLAVDQAAFPIVNAHAAILGQKAMTNWTEYVIETATDTNNHISSHVIDIAADLPGVSDGLNLSTTATLGIKKAINAARLQIRKTTLAATETDELLFVMNDVLAYAMGESQELADYLKGSPDAYDQIKGLSASNNPNAEYGLPRTLYGCEIVVEKTYKVTGTEAAPVTSSVMPTATPFICVRPSSIDGIEGAPATSALTVFTYEEMSVRTKRDVDNERTLLRVTNNYRPIMTAPEGIVLFENALT